MYTKSKYSGKSEKEILEEIESQGFVPEKFSDAPNFVYEPHKHKEEKLLVFLDGEMDVVANNKKFKCQKGDELIISGNVVHSAVVGKNGCSFFWSER